MRNGQNTTSKGQCNGQIQFNCSTQSTPLPFRQCCNHKSSHFQCDFQQAAASVGAATDCWVAEGVATLTTRPIRCHTRPSIARSSSRPCGALKKELIQHLRRTRAMRRSRHHTQKTVDHGQITDAVSIRERPAEVEDRAVPGHWEGDLLFGSNNSQIVTLVERHSRCVMLGRAKSKEQRHRNGDQCADQAGEEVTAGTLQVTDLGSRQRASRSQTLHSGHGNQSLFL